MPMDGRPSVIKVFDAFPNTLFFGLEKHSQMGSIMYTFKIKFETHDVVVDQAHTEQITDIEYTIINGQHIFITASLDSTVKAWTPSPDGKSLAMAISNPLPGKALSLQMLNPTFLIIGLENGTYHGWNLANNAFDSILAHQKGVTAITKVDNFLLSGDREGVI